MFNELNYDLMRQSYSQYNAQLEALYVPMTPKSGIVQRLVSAFRGSRSQYRGANKTRQRAAIYGARTVAK